MAILPSLLMSLESKKKKKLKKTAQDIYKRTLDIEFERDRYIDLGSTIGEGQTDKHTHTHTHRHFF